MAEPVGIQAWRELLDAMIDNKRRHALLDGGLFPMTDPNLGATEEQLRDAEERLGRPLDPQYREFLGVANGWESYYFSTNLLSTSDIGTGDRWVETVRTITQWLDETDTAEDLGVADDPAKFVPIADTDNGYAGCLYLYTDDAAGARAGSVFPLDIDSRTMWPDLYSYLHHENLEQGMYLAEQEMGPHARTWGRDIRPSPPTMVEIVAKLAELTALVKSVTPAQPRPGASQSELNLLTAHLGAALDSEHRELLAATNGLTSSYIGEVLSIGQILDGSRWREGILSAQEFHDELERKSVDMFGPRTRERLSVLQIVGSSSAVPFAVAPGELLAVGPDGEVRGLVRDAMSELNGGWHRPHGGVREYLLKVCDHIWDQTARNR
ncbi:SMI1 / KNR4 family protein [Mycobacteroides salmoniphilum]|uniref:SMI1 / KNR4 family protein n=1 Tax=Mycobacteroides salmoniphilum TaxID=404941 RepID=A0A4R8S5U3_9MYCO|nr:SMI1/KNR4 family protein [Mycobacteroides salmoniphilum]TDZ76064.1 SMI1 / KNR4 family protein [Mycobacteroides salmoniphilum]TDZ83648.1 SMI1 / KNR4 family protein [Mycobacteroides salmoniphilum]TDZ84582.1 SMI1 / KNR4 family protein [Mycobacteroides salmoniphilum]